MSEALFYNLDADFAAVGDGNTDDTQAFANAISQLSTNGGTLQLGPKTYLVKTAGNGFTLPANCRIQGVPGKTSLLLDHDNPNTLTPPYGSLFTFNGCDNIVLQDLQVKRNSAILSNLILIDDCKNVTLRNIVFDGQMSLYAGNALCHGIRYGNDGGVITNLSNIVVDSCEFSGLAFSIYITNNSTASIDGFTVRGCSFHDNYADDVNFNSPNGTFVGGQVIGNRFRNGLSTSNVGGFAIDFANVQNSLISDNIISDYPYNTIHLEDRTSHISITNNIMTNCAKLDESVIQIISGTTFVAITGNNFHQDDIEEGPRQSTAMIYVGPGSGAVTPGAITITGNNFSLSNMWHGIDAFSVARVVVSGNHFEGAGTVSNGVYTGGTNNAVGITNGGPAVVSGNYCFGMNSFIPGTTSAFRTMSGTITNNSVHQCNCGMDLKPTGSCIVTGNYFTNCVHSLVSGSNEVTIAQQAVIALNYAVGCANEMEATHDNFWGGVAETQRMVALNCDDSQGTVGFPIQRFLGSEIH